MPPLIGRLLAARARSFVRVDTRSRDAAFDAYLRARGFTVHDAVTTMSLGRPWLAPPGAPGPRTPALASQAFG